MGVRKLHRGLLLLLLGLLVLPLLASCGPQQKPILIGAPIPLTGPYASDGEQMRMALEMAIEEKNAAGGLLGRPLKLVVGDVGGLEAEKIKAVGERLLGAGVDAIITGYDDGGVDTHTFGGRQVPYLHCNAMTLCTQPVKENPDYWNVFQYCANEVAYGVDAAENLLEKIPQKMGWTPPNTRIAIIKADYAYNIMAADRFRDLAKEKGYEIAVDEVTQFGVVEWGPILSKIEAAQPAYVTFWNLDPTDAARFMIQFRQRFEQTGINALVFMQYTPAIPEFLQLAGKAAEGLLWVTDVATIGPGVAEYAARWQKRFGEPPKAVYAYATRDGFDIWVKAVEQAGCVDCYKKVADNIRSITHQGFCGTYKFTQDDQSVIPAEDLVPVVWHQIWEGESRIVDPPRYKQFDYQIPPWIK